MNDLVKFTLRNLGKRKKRAALTMIGVFIGIAAVVALVALGQGLSNTINEQFEKVGADKIFIQAKDVGGIASTGETAPGQITTHELEVIDKVPGVVERSGMLFRGVKVEFNNLQRTHFLISMPDKKSEADLTNQYMTWEVGDGRLLIHKDKGKVVIGYNLGNKKLYQKDIEVGRKIKIEGEDFDVVGLLKRTGDPGIDNSVVVAEKDARRILNEPEAYSYIVAQSVKGENPEVVAERIKKAIRRDRHQDKGDEDFVVNTSTDLLESFNQVLNIIKVVFVGIALISLLVGGIGIMNTMYTAVLERTKEIGIMKAIGAKNKDVLTLFLVESGVLGTAGGAFGIVIGIGISKIVEFGANAAFGPRTIIVGIPLWLIIGALAFSFLVGAISGVLPARRASRLKPVEALRYE